MVQSATRLVTKKGAANQTEVRRLSDLLRRLGSGGTRDQQPRFSTGSSALDRLLPAGGLRRGGLVEWLGDGMGSGVSCLPLLVARQLQQQDDEAALAVVDRRQRFYPPAAKAWGIDLQRTILIRPDSERDELWALDQTVRCAHLAAVLAWPERIDGYTFRRLQLAAETSGAVVLLVRPTSAMRQPTWADLRLLVSPRPSLQSSRAGWRLNVRLLRCRGRFGEGEVDLEIDETTGTITASTITTGKGHETRLGNLAAKLAHPTANEQTA